MAGWALRRRWLVVAAAALLLAGCGHAGAPRTGVAATATTTPASELPAPSLHLVWQIATAPSTASPPGTYTPAPSDGRVAYACGSIPSGVEVWSTRDRGVTWLGAARLPYTGDISLCQLVVDASDAQRVIATLDTAKMGANPQASELLVFLSSDGGATWRALPRIGPHSVRSLAAFGGALYAAGDGINAAGAETSDVWVSRDGGRSWSALGATSLAPNPLIWMNPQTGELLGTNDYDLIPTLWRSENAGATWTRIAVPNVVGAGAGQGFIVAPMGAGWRVCVAGETAPGPQEKNALACSGDLGQTWTRPTALNLAQQSPKGFTFVAPSSVFAITDDGALLANYSDQNDVQRLARLSPGSSVWEAISDPPDMTSVVTAGPVYTSGPGGGMLWVTTSDAAHHPFITANYP